VWERIRESWRRYNERASKIYRVCPECSQWGVRGRCVGCGFNAADPQAVEQLLTNRANTHEARQSFLGRVSQPLAVVWRRYQWHSVMTSPVLTVPITTPAQEALRILMEHRIKRLPVVDT